MSTLGYQWSYRRHLPHFQPPGATLFVTFRLAGSLPHEAVERLMEEKARVETILNRIVDPKERARRMYEEERLLFGKWDNVLNKAIQGPLWLKDAGIAEVMIESMRYRDGSVYALDAFCVMMNHVHMVFKPLPKPEGGYHSTSSIMHSLKRYVACEANKLLKREGAFWQHESYDHAVRNDDEWRRIVQYVIDNPVSAGLVKQWEDWRWTYCKHL